jgi:hypothetical protein
MARTASRSARRVSRTATKPRSRSRRKTS